MFYLTGIQSKSTNIMIPSQRDGNGGHSSMYIGGGGIFRQKFCIHETLLFFSPVT